MGHTIEVFKYASKYFNRFQKLVFKTKKHNAVKISHLFSRCHYSQNRHVENASYFEPEYFCGSQLNVG